VNNFFCCCCLLVCFDILKRGKEMGLCCGNGSVPPGNIPRIKARYTFYLREGHSGFDNMKQKGQNNEGINIKY